MKSLRSLLLLAALTFLPVLSHGETLVMGVFAYRPKAVMIAQYQPLAEYLSRAVPGVTVDLQVQTQEEMEASLAAGKLDLVFTNPSHFIVLRARNRLTGALATLVSLEKGVAVNVLGGVILAPVSRDDIRGLADLRGKHIAVPGTKFLGGYQAQAYELLLAGIHLPGGAELEVVGSHDAVVEALLAGKADAGFVRSSIVEAMTRENRLPPGRLRVLNEQNDPGFPFASSTRLYPEWAFAALPHVDQATVRQIARALLNVDADSEVAKRAGIAGFTVPGDYSSVEHLARALRLPPYEGTPDFTLEDIWTRYRLESSIGLVLTAVILALTSGLLLGRQRLKATTQELRRMSQRHELLLDTAGEGIFGTDLAGVITFVNPAALATLGHTRSELIGRRAQTLFSASAGGEAECLLDEVLRDGERRRGDDIFVRQSGKRFPVHLSVTAMVEDGEQVGAEVVFQDVTERKVLEEDLIRQATIDPLSGAATRRHFLVQLETEWSRIRRKGGQAALVLLDLDRFKAINDNHGHGAGDAVLREFGRVVRDSLRRFDVFGRLGGDEFAILLPDTDLAGVQRYCERLRAEVSAAAVEFNDISLQMSVSMGLAMMDQDTVGADEAISQADRALYDSKARGRNRISVASADSVISSATVAP